MPSQQTHLRSLFLLPLLLALFACSLTAPGSTPSTEMPPIDPTQPPFGISWWEAETPLFPNAWPPTASTVWVSYTFAYGSNPTQLVDGSYVTAPLAKTEWQNGVATTAPLSNDKTEVTIQGVVPLDEKAQTVLNTGPQVADFCRALTALPAPDQSETQQMLAYYRAWFQYNGAFLNLIRENHVAFIDWVNATP